MPLLGLIALGRRAQIANPEKGNMAERTRRKVEWVDKILLRDYPGICEEKRKPIRKTTITVFHGENESSGCDALVAAAVANGEGQLKFKNPAPGKYEVMFALNGNQFALAVNYTPSKEQVSCSTFSYDVITGELQPRRVIQLD
jgi:hypothetical protein